jgi:hypothetical protein
MGLAERKLIQSVMDGDFKTFQSEINQVCGKDVKLSFDWSLLENHTNTKYIVEEKIYRSNMLDRILTALKNIASDDMGKAALKEGLKEIHMIPDGKAPTFEGGILTVRNGLAGEGAWDTEHIQKVIESKL